MTSDDDLHARLDELDARVRALEADRTRPRDTGGTDAPTDPARGPGGAPDTFWALDGLRARVPSPGAVLYTGTVDLPDGGHVDWQYGLGTQDVLGRDWSASAPTLAALGHPVRLTLLQAALGGTQTVAGMAELDGVGTTGQVYHHVRQLVAAGWLHTVHGRYAVPAERVVPLLTVLAIAGP